MTFYQHGYQRALYSNASYNSLSYLYYDVQICLSERFTCLPQSHVSCIMLWLKLTVGWTLCIKTIGFWDIIWLARKLTSRFCASYIGLIHPAWPPNRICTHLLFCFRASLLMPLTTIVHLGAFRVSLDASKSTCFLWCELMRPVGSYRSRRCMTSMASFPRSLTLSFFFVLFRFFFLQLPIQSTLMWRLDVYHLACKSHQCLIC